MSETINFVEQGYEAWPIFTASNHPAVRLAAEELQRYLGRMTDRRVPIVTDVSSVLSPVIELVYESDGSDGFVRQVGREGIRLIGRSPRGVLCGVYDLLQELGCRWYSPGDLGERVPRAVTIGLPHGIKDEEPAIQGRGLVLSNPDDVIDSAGWIDWAGKNRLNAVCYLVPRHERRARRFKRAWRRVRRAALAELAERGITAEFGGHLMSGLLPRRHFWRKRKAFRFSARRRRRDHNLCASSAEGMEIVRASAKKLFQANAGIDVYHIWPDDAAGAWCECLSCRDLSPSDQAMTVVNEIADVLSAVAPEARISFLAQHETLVAPISVRPRANVMLLYSPRERCYAHTIQDGRCDLNYQRYWSMLRNQAAWFSGSGWPEHGAMEYYADGVWFNSMAPPLANMLGADLDAYRDAGVQRISVVHDANRPWLRFPMNGSLFARLAWAPRQDIDALVQEYALLYFGGPKDLVGAYLAELELAFQLLLDLTPEEVGEGSTARPSAASSQISLGAAGAPAQVRRAKLAALLQARKHVERAGNLLDMVGRPGSGWKPRGRVTRRELLDREQRSLSLVALEFEYLYQRQLAYSLAAETAPRREIGAALRDAGSALQRVWEWGQGELAKSPQFRPEFQRMCLGWQADLWRLRHDALARTELARRAWRYRIGRRLRQIER